MSVEKDDARPARAERVRGLAGRQGRDPQAGPDPVGQRPLDRRAQQRPRDRPHQGPGRHEGRARGVHAGRLGHAHGAASSASASRCRSRPGGSSSATATSSASCGWPASARARTACCAARSTRCSSEGAQAIVLDLRGNGGGLLSEAVLVSSIFIEDGKIVSVRGRTRAERAEDAAGRRDRPEASPSWCSSTAAAPAPPRSSPARCATATARRWSARNTFGKGLVQEVEPLSNGGYLDLTVANYYLPGGKTITTNGHQAAGQGGRQAAHQARRGAAGGARRAARQAVSAAVRGRPARRLDQPLVAVLEKRGRFLVAEPLFGQRPAHRRRARRRRRGRPRARRLGQARRARGAPARAGPTSPATCSRG